STSLTAISFLVLVEGIPCSPLSGCKKAPAIAEARCSLSLRFNARVVRRQLRICISGRPARIAV
ncbi:hypothetical protein ACYCFA_01960, partial [Escherichia coli]